MKLGRSPIFAHKKGQAKKCFHWTFHQQRKYVLFLENNRSLFDLSLKDKKKKGIHSLLSKAIKNRTPTQCRSHHQKMLEKFKNVENIIKIYKNSSDTQTNRSASDQTIFNVLESKYEAQVEFQVDTDAKEDLMHDPDHCAEASWNEILHYKEVVFRSDDSNLSLSNQL